MEIMKLKNTLTEKYVYNTSRASWICGETKVKHLSHQSLRVEGKKNKGKIILKIKWLKTLQICQKTKIYRFKRLNES